MAVAELCKETIASVSIFYGQGHRVELRAAHAVARHYGICQIFDTVLFIVIGFRWFWNPQRWPAHAVNIIGQYVFKLLLAVLDMPSFYLLTRGNRDKSTSPFPDKDTVA